MATLATQCLTRGLALGLTNSTRIVVKNEAFVHVGQGFVGGTGVPVILVIIFVLFIIGSFALNKMTFGRRVLAVGGNIEAARASGINSNTQLVLTYMTAGVFVGVSTIFTIGRAISAQPLAANGLEFEIITAVVIGGTSLMGGTGSMLGTFLGFLLVATIKQGLNMMDVSPYFQYVVKGIVILVAVLADQVGTYKRKIKVDNAAVIKSTHTETKSWQSAMDSIRTGKQKMLQFKNIHKSFPGVKALDDVSFAVKCGSVHALVGENGAGKSTLMKVLSGVYQKDAGVICVDDIPLEIASPIQSSVLGIQVIYQELALVPELSITQNVFLGKEILGKSKIVVNTRAMARRTMELLGKFGLRLNVNRRTNDYTVGQLQMVEIAKAISSNAWVIVMDEPTSVITETDKELLFSIVQELKQKGLAIVYISHRIQEIFEIADEVTVLRDGKTVFNAPIGEVDEQLIIKHMVGRGLDNIFDREKTEASDVILEVKNLYRQGVFGPISFNVRKGEVLGFSGLLGSGRTEIMRCLFGLDKPDDGEIILNGKRVQFTSPAQAIASGLGLVSEDRRREGIVPELSVQSNISLSSLPILNTLGVLNEKKEMGIAQKYVENMSIKTPSLQQHIVNLSGGNQQKCCLARCLSRDPKVLILDEPTRGIDVGAKAEIHKLIDGLAREGRAIIMISSELPEIIGACDRVVVMREGVKVTEFDMTQQEVTQEMLIVAAAGSDREGANV
jgi:ribose transport system ATP-binding protein